VIESKIVFRLVWFGFEVVWTESWVVSDGSVSLRLGLQQLPEVFRPATGNEWKTN
jgi:hypothetical protein